jgi:hypothetical protein
MAEGKVKVQNLGGEGLVGYGTQPSWDFLYEVSSIKNPAYNIGDVVPLPDGREFTFAKSTGAAALYASHGCEFTYTGYISITNFATNASVGDKEITVPAATHAALTADELRGGYVVIFDGASDYYTTVRGIIGNDAAASGAAFKIRLDAALTYAITSGTSKCEVYQNPFAALTVASDAAKPKAGIPAAYVSASAQYFWVQTKGFTWVPPQTSNVGENGGIGCYWRHDGSLEGAEVALGSLTVPAADTSQYAGYCVEGSQAGNGPLFKLQG